MISPCKGICKLDTRREFCVGCFRTLEEIGSWWKLPQSEQERIIEECKLRETAKMNHNIFGIPIYIGHVKDHEAIDKIITQDIIDTTVTYIDGWLGTVRSSARDYSAQQWYGMFHEIVKPNFDEFLQNTFNIKNKYNIQLMRPWINLYTKGSSQEWHSHVGYPNCPIMFSFTYMHKLPKEDSGKLVLKSRNEDYEWHYPEEFKTQSDIYPELQEHDIIIFPSWLHHAVTKHNNVLERITISGDFSVEQVI